MKQFLCTYVTISALLFSAPNIAVAEHRDYNDGSTTFQVRETLSDGKDKRPWREWSMKLPDRPIESVTATVRRVSGGRDTYTNLRFADKNTFEPLRARVNSDKLHDLSWNLGSAEPNGDPLILKAYNGQVYVESITINYADSSRGSYRNNSRNDPGYLSSSDYDRLEDLSEDLLTQSEQVYEEMVNSKDYRDRRIDLGAVSAIENFTRDAREFRKEFQVSKVDYRRIDQQSENLERSAQTVTNELHSPTHGRLDHDIQEQWDDTLDVMDEIKDIYGRPRYNSRYSNRESNKSTNIFDSLFGTR